MNWKIFILLLSIFSVQSQNYPDKSIVIAFDTTGSMRDDLEQLKEAAIEITKDLAEQEENQISEYILVKFNDPVVEEPFVTSDPLELFEELENIHVTGGDDCPELALTGLEAGLNISKPQSFAFIFTDADAKDHYLQKRVIEMIKSKESEVNIVVSDFCADVEDDAGRVVYQNIAEFGHGDVYELPTSSISAAMTSFMVKFHVDYDGLFEARGASGHALTDTFYTDETMEKVLITFTGKDPSVVIRDPLNRVVDFDRTIDLPNVLIGEIHNPVKGRYTLRTSADSPYSIKIGAETKNHFDHKFGSRELEPSRHLIDEDRSKIIIEAKNPSHLNKLTKILINTKNPDDSTYVIDYDMTKISEEEISEIETSKYETNEINFPSTSFEIYVEGIDSDGDKFERFITRIVKESLSESEMETIVKAQEVIVGSSLTLTCESTSLKIYWRFNGEKLPSSSTKTLELVDMAREDAGKYECVSSMGIFEAIPNIYHISVVGEPKLELLNDLSEGEESTLKCSYQSFKETKITWLDESGNILQDGNQFYSFTVASDFIDTTITCSIESEDFKLEKSIDLALPKAVDYEIVDTEIETEEISPELTSS